MVNTKKALQTLYKDTCSIYEYKDIKQGNITKNELVCLDKNVPCKVSFYSGTSNTNFNKEDIFNCELNQKIKIFLDNNIQIKAGSIIEIKRNDVATLYKNASKSTIYTNHQEVVLNLYNDKC